MRTLKLQNELRKRRHRIYQSSNHYLALGIYHCWVHFQAINLGNLISTSQSNCLKQVEIAPALSELLFRGTPWEHDPSETTKCSRKQIIYLPENLDVGSPGRQNNDGAGMSLKSGRNSSTSKSTPVGKGCLMLPAVPEFCMLFSLHWFWASHPDRHKCGKRMKNRKHTPPRVRCRVARDHWNFINWCNTGSAMKTLDENLRNQSYLQYIVIYWTHLYMGMLRSLLRVAFPSFVWLKCKPNLFGLLGGPKNIESHIVSQTPWDLQSYIKDYPLVSYHSYGKSPCLICLMIKSIIKGNFQ